MTGPPGSRSVLVSRCGGHGPAVTRDQRPVTVRLALRQAGPPGRFQSPPVTRRWNRAAGGASHGGTVESPRHAGPGPVTVARDSNLNLNPIMIAGARPPSRTVSDSVTRRRRWRPGPGASRSPSPDPADSDNPLDSPGRLRAAAAAAARAGRAPAGRRAESENSESP